MFTLQSGAKLFTIVKVNFSATGISTYMHILVSAKSHLTLNPYKDS
jgi:hypothetical protein